MVISIPLTRKATDTYHINQYIIQKHSEVKESQYLFDVAPAEGVSRHVGVITLSVCVSVQLIGEFM